MTTKLGITGGIGSGKSVVSCMLEIMGVPVYISDERSKWLTNNHPQIKKELIDLLGEEVFKDGSLNKIYLASCIFGNKQTRLQVNAIIHPIVKSDFAEWVTDQECRGYHLVAMESAILIEAGFKSEVDYTVMVYAPLDLRIERAMKRDNTSEELIKKRIESQMDDERKRELADFVILNDEKTLLIPQLNKLIREYRR